MGNTGKIGVDTAVMTTSFEITPVGVVRKTDNETRIEIYAPFEEALLGLEGFSHITVCYWFHRNDTTDLRKTLRVHPRKNEKNPLTGVFATHSPVRPNLIALSSCRISRIDGRVISIEEIDALDGSPVIDIKPHIPTDKLAASEIKLPAWVAASRDDGAISETKETAKRLKHLSDRIEILSGGPEFLDRISPLWEWLKGYHIEKSLHFSEEMRSKSFAERRKDLISKSNLLRVDIAFDSKVKKDIGYCITTVDNNHRGEIDSLFIEKHYRRRGIGRKLTEMAVAWLKCKGAVDNSVHVAYGNEEVFDFYKSFGFYPRDIHLFHK